MSRLATAAGREASIVDAMGTETEQRAHLLFVVRLWVEPGGIAERRWRGYIEEVASTQRLYFSQVAELADFIRLRQEDVS